MADETGEGIPEEPALIGRPFRRGDVVSGLKTSFGELGKAIVHGALLVPMGGATIGNVVDNVFAIPGAFAAGEPPEAKAWTLVHRAAVQAFIELVGPVMEARPELKDDFAGAPEDLPDINLEDAEFGITVDFFDRPTHLPMAGALRRTFEAWLPKLGLQPPEIRSIVGRFDSHWAAALHDEWRRNPADYSQVLAALQSPFARANAHERDWLCYRRWLIRQTDQAVFDEAFGIRQIYVPLRAWFAEESPDDEKGVSARYRNPEESLERKVVVDLADRARAWWCGAETLSDAILLVSGGPGSGKSSFAKKFAADLLEWEPDARVLFLPLQRMNMQERTLRDAMGEVLAPPKPRGDEHFHQNPVTADGFPETDRRTLLIFDGLDELTKPGDTADDQTRRFVTDLTHALDNWNRANDLRVRALITGRTPTAQAHQDNLKVALPWRLHVLRLHLTANERQRYHDPESRLKVDQRDAWWVKYNKVKHGTEKSMPKTLEKPRFQELTAEPLLAYFVATSGFTGTGTDNRNALYEKLFEDVAKRSHDRGGTDRRGDDDRAALAPYHEYKTDFDQIMEAFATAAWRGDGRTADLADVENACIDELRDRLSEMMSAKQGRHRLIATFYMQMGGPGRAEAFEFTHKSLSEYLTARRLVREIRNMHQLAHSFGNPEIRVAALRGWFKLCAPQPISHEIRTFLVDEIRLWHGHEAGKREIPHCQATLATLFDLNLADGMPALEGSRSFREAEARATNSEEALLAAVDACARATGRRWSPKWKDGAIGAARLIGRLRHGAQGPQGPVSLQLFARMDLSGQMLGNADLRDANLVGANLEGANLMGASLENADLRGADLRRAALSTAKLRKANLAGANLQGAELMIAHVMEANLVGADLRNATLRVADLWKADLRRAALGHARLQNAKLTGAKLGDASLEGASLVRADLRSADLRSADLRSADLRKADLRNADLRNADLRSADLRNADLEGADLQGADLKGADLRTDAN